MGTKLGNIIKVKTVTLNDLSGRKVAVDALNTLYQFLSSIRQSDGTPLMDQSGRVTSHLSGLFYRNVNLLERGILLIYVFDCKAPQLKIDEIKRRREIRDNAYKAWKKAKVEGRIEDARKAGQASSRLTSNMIEESKKLLIAMGILVIQAPSEGEALAAQMAREGLVWASASQDNDSLLYNCPRTIRNLSISGRRKIARSKTYKTVHPEIVDLDLNLKILGITREQLIDIAILIGTDYNEKVPRIGPKTALKLIKQYGSLEKIESEKGMKLKFPYVEIRGLFLNPPMLKMEKLEWPNLEPDEIKRILCTEHNFSEDRVQNVLNRLSKI